ncbi:MAG: GNAT family N-acetyltransferase [Treponema sp.]|nr:GNAT family N-acetyltransferase [Treponema sp.]
MIVKMTEQNIDEVINFILPNEFFSCGLIARITEKRKPKMPESNTEVFILKYNNTIHGIILFANGNLCMHHLPFCKKNIPGTPKKSIINDLKNLFAYKNLYCITGEKNATKFVQQIYWDKAKIQYDYELRIFDSSIKCTNFYKTDLAKNFTIVKCTEKDADKLLPLQIKYEIIEVLPNPESLNETICYKNLIHSLKTQTIIAIKENKTNIFCAKAGTNAIGINLVQLGGVFTDEKFRGKGFAKFLVRHLAEEATKNNKGSVLFVKENNESAKKAYTNAGFKIFGSYRIVYY